MVVLFKNAEKGTYFFIDSVKGTANFVPYRAVNTFFVYKDYLELEVLTLPDYSTVQKFKRLIAKGALKDVPQNDIKKVILDSYPEYFI